MNGQPNDAGSAATGDLVVIQRNPTSGSGRRRRILQELIRELKARAYRLRLFSSRDRLDQYVREPKNQDRLRCLVAAGGDGTVSSLVTRHPQLPIAVLPMGTENLIARHLQLPRNGATIAEMIHHGHLQTFDTAMAGSSPFLIMASAGPDADIVHQLHASRTGNIRHWSYLRPILKALAGFPGPLISVMDRTTGQLVTGRHVIVSNFSEYGLNLQLNPDADPTDGELDVCVFQGQTRRQLLTHAVRSRLGAHTSTRTVRFRSRRVLVQPAEPAAVPAGIPMQTDGDPADHLPVEICINPSSMRLLVRSPQDNRLP